MVSWCMTSGAWCMTCGQEVACLYRLMVPKPLEAHGRRGVLSGAEGYAWLNSEADGWRWGRLCPRGHYPELILALHTCQTCRLVTSECSCPSQHGHIIAG